MSIEKVKAYLDKFSAGGRIRQFPVSSATVPEAAAALHCDEARIAKTMSFAAPDGAILVVTAGDMKIDNRKFKDTFHIKAAMLPAQRCGRENRPCDRRRLSVRRQRRGQRLSRSIASPL